MKYVLSTIVSDYKEKINHSAHEAYREVRAKRQLKPVEKLYDEKNIDGEVKRAFPYMNSS